MKPSETREDVTVGGSTAALSSDGFVRIDGPFQTSDVAFDAASALVEECRLERGLAPMSCDRLIDAVGSDGMTAEVIDAGMQH